MVASGDFRRACDSWRRFHLRNWPIISLAFVGTLGSNLVVLATLGVGATIGSCVLMCLGYLAGLTAIGRI